MRRTTTAGPIQELQKIASEEGVAALWKGVGPAMTRAATLTASQLATYDESKQVNNPIFTGNIQYHRWSLFTCFDAV